MKEMLQGLFGDDMGNWADVLKDKAGFTAEQSKTFVSGFFDKVGGAFDGGAMSGFNPMSLMSGDGVKDIASKIDLSGLAEQAGVSLEQAQTGMQELVPNIVSTLQEKLGPLAGLLGGAGGGDDDDDPMAKIREMMGGP